MNFEWDDAENRANIQKHGISFEQAQTIFDGVIWSRVDEHFEYGETRFVTIGLLERVAVIVVVYTDRYGKIRIISARSANRKERRRYYEEVQKAFGG